MFENIDSIRDAGFEGFVSIEALLRTKLAAVPEKRGVYLVLRTEFEQPIFLERSPAGHFRDKDPTVPIADLQSRWVEGTPVLYIGKAGKDGQGATLKSRLVQYLAFGSGSRTAHHGGRLIWQVAGSRLFLICWKDLPDEDPEQVERGLLAGGRYHSADAIKTYEGVF